MNPPDTVLEQISPLGNVNAILEDDGRVVYVYLQFENPPEGTEPTRACWVRNRVAAPAAVNPEELRDGTPPLMPLEFCRFPDGSPPFDPEHLRFVWLEEGNGVALLEDNKLLAVVPPWSGMGNFDGYSRDCLGEAPFAWPLPEGDVLQDRVRQADEYWQLWDGDFWPPWRDAMIERLESTLGPHSKYYAIDDGDWPPRAIVRFDLANCYVLATVGMSLLPMPAVEMSADDPSPLRRIELAAAFDVKIPEAEVSQFASYLSAQVRLPWNHWTWLGDGHTVPCDSTPRSAGGSRYPAVLLAKEFPGVFPIRLPDFRGDPINLLWTVPITASQREIAMKQSSAALKKELKSQGRSVAFPVGC